ncbi:Oidioi.mRNA.OKI2018_I69.PAR.g12973.t1.cds [Oikopleura dioica]|uniref:Oidioi.mRNA.OKI2018_I69.PAR.g12973.t1.cds n=1 Tax=Oikopleura dioica TaxID=34765 RepID=A0ABN7S7B4_OIKDI|nr:Oidioi.mRNA.OKI2018_I69.PAR.g12973.t1.cds [Oikopleura dioica]
MDDWDSVTVISKSRPARGTANEKSALRQAQRSGNLETRQKMFAGTNNKGNTAHHAKLDRETEELKHKTLGMDVGKLIQKGRNQKGMTQKELATKICEKPQVINEYELGKSIPNNQILGKIERVIGIKLRGKDKGQPMAQPKPKK